MNTSTLWYLHYYASVLTLSFLFVDFFRAEAKLLEETARPLIDTLGEITVSCQYECVLSMEWTSKSCTLYMYWAYYACVTIVKLCSMVLYICGGSCCYVCILHNVCWILFSSVKHNPHSGNLRTLVKRCLELATNLRDESQCERSVFNRCRRYSCCQKKTLATRYMYM